MSIANKLAPSRTGIRYDAIGKIKVDVGDAGEADPGEFDHEAGYNQEADLVSKT